MARKLLWILLMIAAIIFSPGAILRWKIGQSVAAKMPELVGPARSYSAGVSGGLFQMLCGRIDSINIRGKGVKLASGVQLNRLDINLTGVRFKPDQTVTSIESTVFSASVTQRDLNYFFATSRPDMSNAKISLDDGKLALSASPRVMAVRTPVSLEGTLQIVKGTRLNLVLNKLRARGMRVPGFVRGRIMRGINPVLDTQQMGIDAKLSSVKIDDGKLTASGSADVSKALAKK